MPLPPRRSARRTSAPSTPLATSSQPSPGEPWLTHPRDDPKLSRDGNPTNVPCRTEGLDDLAAVDTAAAELQAQPLRQVARRGRDPAGRRLRIGIARVFRDPPSVLLDVAERPVRRASTPGSHSCPRERDRGDEPSLPHRSSAA